MGIYELMMHGLLGGKSKDKIPPPPITNFKAENRAQALLLTWENPDDTDFVGVRILRKTTGFPTGPTDGTIIYVGTGESYLDTNLVLGTTYYYRAFTFDFDNNLNDDTSQQVSNTAIENLPVYHGAGAALASARHALVGAHVGEYAIFAGGGTTSGTYQVDIYDGDLIRTNGATLTTTTYYASAVSQENRAIIAGGRSGSTMRTNVYRYTPELVRSSASLSVGRYSAAGVWVGQYALIAGGDTSTETYATTGSVEVFDADMVRSESSLSESRGDPAAVTLGRHALVAGGYHISSGRRSSVDAFDESLVRSALSPLTVARMPSGAVAGGEYAVFVGGEQPNSMYEVDFYDSDLVKLTPSALTVGRGFIEGISFGSHAVFTGGFYYSNSYMDIVETFDEQLTHHIVTPMQSARAYHAVAIAGKEYLVIAGGRATNTVYLSSVDVYKLG